MAKKEKKPEVKLERVYNVPLRRQWLKVPRYKRAKKAVRALREFLAKHMKADINNVKIEKYANLKLWERGIKNPPHHIKVTAKKDDAGIVRAELEGAPEEEKAPPKKAPKKPAEEKKGEKKPEEKKVEEKPAEEEKEEPKEKPKPEKTEKQKQVEKKVEELEKEGKTTIKAEKPEDKKE